MDNFRRATFLARRFRQCDRESFSQSPQDGTSSINSLARHTSTYSARWPRYAFRENDASARDNARCRVDSIFPSPAGCAFAK